MVSDNELRVRATPIPGFVWIHKLLAQRLSLHFETRQFKIDTISFLYPIRIMVTEKEISSAAIHPVSDGLSGPRLRSLAFYLTMQRPLIRPFAVTGPRR